MPGWFIKVSLHMLSQPAVHRVGLMTGIKILGPARASLFMNLLPIFVAVAAAGLLGETLHGYHAVGGLLALAGVWWGQQK
jgi:drug/metabolite transporter (DMT)-like permease